MQKTVPDLASLQPAGSARLRLMFDGFRKALTFAGLIVLAVAVGSTFLARFLIQLEGRYEAEGAITPGTVENRYTRTETSRDTDGRRRTSTTHWVEYRFSPEEGMTLHGKDSVGRSLYGSLPVGATVEVQYLQSDPSTNRVAQEAPGRAIAWILLLPGLTGLAALVLLGIAWRRAGRHLRLLRHGRAVDGVVKDKRPNPHVRINGRPVLRIRYQFEADGGVCTAEENVYSRAIAETLQPGDPVVVVFDPRDPSRSRLFRARWMRLLRSAGALQRGGAEKGDPWH